MCINIQKSIVTTEPIIAYKSVKPTKIPGVYRSPVPAYSRDKQKGSKTAGRRLLYEIGKTVKSECPGIFLRPRKAGLPYWLALIEVEIPAGSQMYIGKYDDNEVTASTVKVLRVVREAR